MYLINNNKCITLHNGAPIGREKSTQYVNTLISIILMSGRYMLANA